MLTIIEKILFTLLALGSLYYAYRSFDRIRRIIRRGAGRLATDHLFRRIVNAGIVFVTQYPTFKRRLLVDLAHAGVAGAFVFYLLVNIGDGLQGFIPAFVFLGEGTLGNVYRLSADLISVAGLAGMATLLLRRALVGHQVWWFHPETTLHPKVKPGIRRDSLIVGAFILVHVGSRFLGNSFHLAATRPDAWQPFASAVSGLWSSLSPDAIILMQHVFFWGALGSILLFIPYFLYSKHVHLFMAPLNFLLKPQRKSIGQLDKIDFEDESLQQFGAARLEHLSQAQLFDAYACIMCNRCQDVCPANATGKVLSPSALEINKRYQINAEGAALAAGQESKYPLTEFAISAEAIWACTTCGACVEVCPVNDEPMRDILDIRRNLVLMENRFPNQLQQAFRGMERAGNPWGIAPDARLDWARGLDAPTIEQNPEPDLLWWVGCAPATDARAQKTARDFAKILNAAGVNFAVLGKLERCTGDSARRAGNEALFFELASANVEVLNEVKPKRIVTTCPHCLHTLGNEYPAFGGNYTVIHHTQLIEELLLLGKLHVDPRKQAEVAFHDPCYLGRHNGVYAAPRNALTQANVGVAELSRNRNNSFCCGAGGAQMWKEEEPGRERVSANRFREAAATGRKTLAVGCPFCMIMLTDAAKAEQSTMQVKDVAEIVVEAM
ncbi:MAG TPA: (Fe-S)-binding protein [Anaerolineae bacterium]|nr:(Fe-S)-binding protein [Anaerolineae bacterium]